MHKRTVNVSFTSQDKAGTHAQLSQNTQQLIIDKVTPSEEPMVWKRSNRLIRIHSFIILAWEIYAYVMWNSLGSTKEKTNALFCIL